MDQRVEERTRELLVSNKRLQEEIRQRAQAENKLELAMQDVQKLAEQRSQQLEAVQAHVERHERLRALGQMSSGIAHELNNKLAPIVTYAEMVRREADLDERQSKRIDAILQSARDAANVIDNLQSFHGDRSRELRKSVSMPRLIEQVKYLTRPFWKDAAEADGRKIRFEVESADVPPVIANPVQIRQVLTNLILNAVDSIPESGVITVRLESSADAVSFTISDDGQGMTIEDTKRCFEPFFTTKEHGTGLGLSVCHGIIQAHGGTLEVESSLTTGTRFRVNLPSCPSSAEGTHKRPSVARDALPYSLLLVDDNDSVRSSTKQVLEILGAKVTEANSAYQALRSLRELRFDAVITDLGMPEMDGCELIEHMREEGITAPAILMSGWPAAKIQKRTEKKAKPTAIVKKPATTQELVNAVQDVISKAGQRNADRTAFEVG
jgi:signal transduction histidine kinase/ActR/RegA family two-component response regulator